MIYVKDFSLGEAALWYATNGFAVFPLKPKSKVPATEHGLKDATTDEEKIRDWWSKCPDYNVGIATGEASGGLVVIDLDVDLEKGKDGVAVYKEWTNTHGKHSKTWMSLTGRGGLHLLYRDSSKWKNTVGRNTGIDIRAEGGYIVAPPSIHPNGRLYEWVKGGPGEMEIAEADDVVRNFLRGQEKQNQAKKDAPEGAEILMGERNNTLFKLASSLQAKGLSDEAISAAIEIENETRCSKPLKPKEINTLVRSVLTRYEKGTASYDQSFADNEELTGERSLRPDEFTDLQEASKFVEFYGVQLRFNGATGFLAYDGVRWTESEEKARLKVHEFVRRQELEAGHLLQKSVESKQKLLEELDGRQVKDGSKEAKRMDTVANDVESAADYLAKALSYQNSGRMAAVLKEAAPMVHIEMDKLDSDGYLLNTPAGIVNLRTGEIRDHSPEDYVTKVTLCAPSEEGSEEWKKFLQQVTSGDADLQEYLQYCFGMGAIGEVRQEKLLIAYGSGGNGKSTLTNAVATVLGEYSGVMPAEILTLGNKKNNGPQLARLRGTRLVLASELSEGQRLNTAAVKHFCSTDVVNGDPKFKAPFEYVPTYTVVLSTNHLPTVGTVDNGTWSRLVVIPFVGVFRDTNAEILNYATELVSRCGGAILKWVIEGAVKFIADGYKLPVSQVVKDTIAEYREDSNWLTAFLEECCETDKSYKVGAKTLQEKFASYCDQIGECRRSPSEFKAAVKNAGFEATKTNTGTVYYGLRLKAGEDQ